MNGLELSYAYFEQFGKPMLETEYADVLPYLAVGFAGSGSDRFGFDDEISRDHDFEPGFCIFLPGEDIVDRRTAFLLERSYSKLPKEFAGFKRPSLSPVGGNRNGVMRTTEFYRSAVGSPTGELSPEEWLSISDESLAEAVNGKIFFDNYGEFSSIRLRLSSMPEDIRLKRIAGNLLIMAQSGQYNFIRCLKHGEPEAAQLACREFVYSCMKAFFLLNNRYMPYYKWSFRALRLLEGEGRAPSPDGKISSPLASSLSFLLFGDHREPSVASEKFSAIEKISSDIIQLLKSQNLTRSDSPDLEKHAYSVNDRISDSIIRNYHILAGVQ